MTLEDCGGGEELWWGCGVPVVEFGVGGLCAIRRCRGWWGEAAAIQYSKGDL